MNTLALQPSVTPKGIVYQYNGLQGLNGVAEDAAKVGQISGTIAAIATSTGLVPVASIAGAVAGVASIVGRIVQSKSLTKSAIQQTEAENQTLRDYLVQIDSENKKLANLINANNKSIVSFNGICLFDCADERKLNSAQEQYAYLQKEIQSRLSLSAQLAERALVTVERLAGLRTESNVLLWGGGIALALSVGYLAYKKFAS